MNQEDLRAGAGERTITPPVGVTLAGWYERAAGDNLSRYVRDELRSKALVLQQGRSAWALISNDLVGVDGLATDRIRRGIAEQTDLSPDAIMVCATHCHSGPVVCPVAAAMSWDEIGRSVVGADGKVPDSYGKVETGSAEAAWAGKVDLAWREWFISQAIEAGISAWRALRPAELAFAEAKVDGVASSRRVRLSDGTWADPRRDPSQATQVVSRTEIDPFVRMLLLREQDSGAPLAAVVNYGSHPWIFSIPAISAELPGATAEKVAAAWRAADAAPPVVLFATGPEGDATLIWNVDIDQVWRMRPGESPAEGLKRREQGYDRELDRLSGLLAEGVIGAISQVQGWNRAPGLSARRRPVALPLKKGYVRPEEILVAEWQKEAPPSRHLTEVQLLQAGQMALLGLPGETFVALGRAIRDQAPFRELLIATLANDSGALSYIGDRAAYELGGYELMHTPIAAGGGEILVEEAVLLLKASVPFSQ